MTTTPSGRPPSLHTAKRVLLPPISARSTQVIDATPAAFSDKRRWELLFPPRRSPGGILTRFWARRRVSFVGWVDRSETHRFEAQTLPVGFASLNPPYDQDFLARTSTPARRSSGCTMRSEEHTSELQSHLNLVCRLLLEKKKNKDTRRRHRLTLLA